MMDLQAGADALTQHQQRDEEARRAALIEAYWKLRDHAAGSRETSVYQRAKEAYEADMTQRGYVAVEWKCRGIEVAARDLAEMLGVPEHEIERPPGTSEVTDGR